MIVARSQEGQLVILTWENLSRLNVFPLPLVLHFRNILPKHSYIVGTAWKGPIYLVCKSNEGLGQKESSHLHSELS